MAAYIYHFGVAFWVAFVAAALLSRPIFAALLKMKSRQEIYQYAPGTHQVKQGTPTMGGIIIVAGFLLAAVATQTWRGVSQISVFAIPYSVMAVFSGFAVIGFLDDYVMPKVRKSKRGLAWKEKIVLQFLVALGAAWLQWGVIDVRGGLAVFLVLFAANAYNFADGLDGLAGSILLGLLLGVSVLALDHAPWVVIMSAALAGALIPFLYLNAPPARIFMGDVGSLAIGAAVGFGLTELLIDNPVLVQESQAPWRTTMIVPVLLLSGMLLVELVPVPIQIASVKLFKRKVFPFTPVHHAFEKAGWPETRVVWSFAIAQLLFTVAAIFASTLVTGFTIPYPSQGGSGIP